MTSIDRTQGFELHWGTFETLSPLVQSYPGSTKSETLGDSTFSVVHTRTWVIGNANIPVVSSNSLRSAVRQALGYHLLDTLGVKRSDVKLSAAHLLVAGGSLGTKTENTLTPDRVSEVRKTIPSLALFGGTALGGFLHGRLMMGTWVAQTKATPSSIVHVKDGELTNIEGITFDDFFVRAAFEDVDDYAPDATSGVKVGKSAKSKRTAIDPIPYGAHAVAPGVTFAGWAALGNYRGLSPEDDLVQRACLRFGIEKAFRLDKDGVTVLGLRASAGYGIVRFNWDLTGIAESTEPYLRHIQDHAGDIRSMLTSDQLVPTQKKSAQSKDDSDDAPANGADDNAAFDEVPEN